MSRRKRIALFAAYPEMVHVRRITEGIMHQCRKYDYDLCVFASSMHLSFPHENYIRGERNIYELANLDEFDGIILDESTLTGDPDKHTLTRITERLKEYPDLPKFSLEIPIEGTTLISNDNENVLREMVRHVIDVHGRKKICLLTGNKGISVSDERLNVFLDEIHKHGLEVLPEHRVYGDFWYFGGDSLARKIVSGEVPMPDAVICASDCMAIGLMDRLIKNGIRVPEDILVIGFDATDEGAVNSTTLSSYDPGDIAMGADAVDHIRALTDPGAPIEPYIKDSKLQFHPGMSCGCLTDPVHAMKRFRSSLYISSYNQADEDFAKSITIGNLMESYAMESFTASESPDECLKNIYQHTTQLMPYRYFYLCLRNNWLNMAADTYDGYPEQMSIFSARSTVENLIISGEADAVVFNTSEMIPLLHEERKEAGIFYFSPVHYDGVFLGYAVLQRELAPESAFNIVYRTWLRYINNSLEMIRSKERLKTISVRDEMTGALNRRGMYEQFHLMCSNAAGGDSLFIGVIDMDGLKFINDTFGHSEGDLGIKTLCEVLSSVTRKNEICVRSGGDEFFLIGIGKYTRSDEAERAAEFTEAMEKRSKQLNKPYNVSASIGIMVFDEFNAESLDSALSIADEKMYNYKMRHRRHRSV